MLSYSSGPTLPELGSCYDFPSSGVAMLSIFLVSSSVLFHLAHVAFAVLGWTLHAIGTCLKVFAAAEVGCALLLLVVVGIFRVGRIPTKPRRPLLSAESPGRSTSTLRGMGA